MKLSTSGVKQGMLRSLIFVGVTAISLTAQPALAAEESDDEWNFNGALYLWAADIDLEDSNGDSSTVSFSEIVDNLDYVFMGHFGGQKDKLGFMIDTIYLNISESEDYQVAPGVTHDKTEIISTIITPVMTYRVVEDGQHSLDILGGMRYLNLDINLKFDVLPDLGDDATVYNGVVGFRGNIQLDQNWHVPFYYDVGKGDSELTYQAYTGINYAFSSFDLHAGYRYMKFKFDDDDEFGDVLDTMVIKGPIIGAKFWF